VLVLASPHDRLVPVRGVRATAARYDAEIVEFPGMGHDLMLDARWREPLDAMLTWLAKVAPPSSPSS
jgi:pimeloyl-ACP methyl ester carboxylesterase